MIILKITCDGKDCHGQLSALHPTVVSVYHEPNNHILIFKKDYDKDGHVKKSSITPDEMQKVDLKFSKKFLSIYDKEFV